MLSEGSRLGRYEIRSQAGRGGMGEVYRAWDAGLRRTVAIKVLPDEIRQDGAAAARFESEARAAAALSHPNIITIYDVGREGDLTFEVMELLDGETLRDHMRRPLPIREAVAFARQIADGLAAAHEHGIIHRDIKPENLFVTSDGRLKILDFGLARTNAEIAGSTCMTAARTATGAVVGTVGYMSPEQLTGQPVDQRTDIFSFGCVLYEMLTSKRPFAGASTPEMIHAVLTRDPEPLPTSVPDPLQRLLARCLARNPAERLHSMRDVLLDLNEALPVRPRRRARVFAVSTAIAVTVLAIAAGLILRVRGGGDRSGAPRLEPATLAVLPFTSISQPAGDYFADGITESLMFDLSRVRGLAVIGRTTALQYKGRNVDARTVGKQIGATHVLSGTVQRTADRVRVIAELVDARTGSPVWSSRFDRTGTDLLALEDELARGIASGIDPQLRAPAAQRYVPSTEANDAYMRGVFQLHRFGRDGIDQAITALEQAVTLDPRFALAHSKLATAYTERVFFFDSDPKWQEHAFVHIATALEIDPNLAEAYLARAELSWSLRNHFPHEQAVRDLKRALELNPNLAEAHAYLGMVYVHVGLLERAEREFETALKLDPSDNTSQNLLAATSLYRNQCGKLDELRPRVTSPQLRAFIKSESLWCRGRYAEALAVFNSELKTPNPLQIGIRARLLAGSGHAAEARAALRQVEPVAENKELVSHRHHLQIEVAAAHALLGNRRDAMKWMRQAAAEGWECYPCIANDSAFRSLESEQDFREFMAELRASNDRWKREM